VEVAVSDAKPTREQVDEIFRTSDTRLIDGLAQAVARGCIAYDVRLPVGCLTAITKSILFTLEQRKKGEPCE
jgi:hypothetical protein